VDYSQKFLVFRDVNVPFLSVFGGERGKSNSHSHSHSIVELYSKEFTPKIRYFFAEIKAKKTSQNFEKDKNNKFLMIFLFNVNNEQNVA
jgi:hypothetical protein